MRITPGIYKSAVAGLLGILVGVLPMGCGPCDYCDQLASATQTTTPNSGSKGLDAAYTNATTTVGSLLRVVPQSTGSSISSAIVHSGNLPAGMVLNSDGSILGTPTTSGIYALQIQLCSTDTCITRSVIVTVNGTLTNPIQATYADAVTTVGTPLAVDPTVSIGGPSVQASVITGSLPPGMSLDASGRISGTPTTAGVYSLQITMKNASGAQITVPLIITVNGSASSLLTAHYSDSTVFVGSSLSVPPTTDLGGPITSAILDSGIIPPGTVLNPAGTIQGNPTAVGAFTARITLGNASAAKASCPVTITVIDSGSTLLEAAYPHATGRVGDPFTLDPVVTVGGPIQSSVLLTGSLPSGLTLGSDGRISGVPSASGVFTLSVQVCNASGACLILPVQITVNPKAPIVSYTDAVTTVGTPLQVVPQNSGGVITSASLATGPIPNGMSLQQDGSITGTPTTAGVYPLQVQVCGHHGERCHHESSPGLLH